MAFNVVTNVHNACMIANVMDVKCVFVERSFAAQIMLLHVNKNDKRKSQK